MPNSLEQTVDKLYSIQAPTTKEVSKSFRWLLILLALFYFHTSNTSFTASAQSPSEDETSALLTPELAEAETGTSTQNLESSNIWESFPIGQVAHSIVLEPPPFIYLEPDFDSPPEERISNQILFDEALNVSARNTWLNKGHIVRLRIIDENWGEIVREYGIQNPYLDNQQTAVYVPLEYFKPFENLDLPAFNVFPETQKSDKLIVVIHNDNNPELIAFEGNTPILRVPVVLGDTPYGDFRIWRKRLSDNMPGIAGVPFSQCFSGGYCLHGAPWWNWQQTKLGHYGSAGCVNLEDDEWFQLNLQGNLVSIDQWLFQWTSTNLSYDIEDSSIEEAVILAENPEWYQATGSVRTIVVPSIESLNQFPATNRLGPLAASSQITDFETLIEAYKQLENSWLLPQISEAGELSFENQPIGISVAEKIAEEFGQPLADNPWVMLTCDDREIWQEPAALGASRTIGELCNHMYQDRPGSICTPERVDLEFLGERGYCLKDRFENTPNTLRGQLLEHEGIHLYQLGSPIASTLFEEGVILDDPNPRKVENSTPNLGAWMELGAQHHDEAQNSKSYLANFYHFVLAKPINGQLTIINYYTTTSQALDHLHQQCGDPNREDILLREIIERALLLEPNAYQELSSRCQIDPHLLIPDYVRG